MLMIFNKYVDAFKNRAKKFVFNPRIIEGFEAWINVNTTMYMTKYIEGRMSAELKQEEELDISGDFTQKGVDYVSSILLSQMPIFYKNYMTQFYGEDRLIFAVREKVRYLFIKFVESVVKKRTGGGVISTATGDQKE
jgi:hypothetical protein